MLSEAKQPRICLELNAEILRGVYPEPQSVILSEAKRPLHVFLC